MVLALHQWLERFSPAGIPYYGAFEGAPLPEVERDPQKLFDTWNTHTRRCKICKTAHDNMVKGQPLAWVVAAVAAVQATILTASSAATNASALAAAGMPASAATTASAFSLPPPGALACLAVALLAVGVALLMGKLVGLFHVFPFSHADNH
ncbi:(2Fe-2S)-binding protein [Haematococcus lacustris]|uniref:(2Fe-2S)-binding protein n=1 Tax=Haematococcus lacustris TaxID=44745 RepID=A0A699ZI75_HAELA|nr:(2Fe-2S)-binding protein [Haematococcus lacustris]